MRNTARLATTVVSLTALFAITTLLPLGTHKVL